METLRAAEAEGWEGEDARWREELALERELEEDTLGMRALLTLRHAHAPRPSTARPCGARPSRIYYCAHVIKSLSLFHPCMLNPCMRDLQV